MTVHPNNWLGLLVALGTCLGSYLWVVALMEWDDPDRTRRDRDILGGPFSDDRR